MKRVGIKADLERRLRAYKENHLGSEDSYEVGCLVEEVVALLDKEDVKRAAGSTKSGDKPGLGYKELVALFRFQLGGDLALPPAPSAAWIVRIVNKAREQGINLENVEQISRGLRRNFRPPYSLDFVIFRASEHYSRGAGGAEGEVDGQHLLYTGRENQGG